MELPFIKNCTKSLRSVFPVVGYAYTNVSTYPCGQIGFLLAGKDKVFYSSVYACVFGIVLSVFAILYKLTSILSNML